MSNDAQRAKNAAMAQVGAAANPAWLDLMLQLAFEVSQKHPFFTSDDVMAAYHAIQSPSKPLTHEPRALGPVMRQAARLGYCQKASVPPLPSRRRSRHACPLAVWRSLVFDASGQIAGRS